MSIRSVSFNDNLSESIKSKEKELQEYESKIPVQEELISELKSLIDEDSEYQNNLSSFKNLNNRSTKEIDLEDSDVEEEVMRYKIENVLFY